MKFRITMKDPDGVYDGITEAVESSLVGLKLTSDEDEFDFVVGPFTE